MLSIIKHELRRLFLSPLAWCVLAVKQIILAWLFLLQLEVWLTTQNKLTTLSNGPGVTDIVLVPLYSLAGIILLLLSPLLSMRMLADERRNQSLHLLLSSPVSISAIIMGKYLALLIFISLSIVLLFIMAISLSAGTTLDYGQLLSCSLGLLLLMASFTAISLFFSSVTQHAVIAALLSLGFLLMLWIINLANQTRQHNALLDWLSLFQHQQRFYHGVLHSSDIIYYLLISSLFILFSIRHLDNQRL